MDPQEIVPDDGPVMGAEPPVAADGAADVGQGNNGVEADPITDEVAGGAAVVVVVAEDDVIAISTSSSEAGDAGSGSDSDNAGDLDPAAAPDAPLNPLTAVKLAVKILRGLGAELQDGGPAGFQDDSARILTYAALENLGEGECYGFGWGIMTVLSKTEMVFSLMAM